VHSLIELASDVAWDQRARPRRLAHPDIESWLIAA
jgi:hypothetical protein